MKELISQLDCTETYDKENILINIFIYLLENETNLHDGLQVFVELSKLRDYALSDGSESYFEEYVASDEFMTLLYKWTNDDVIKLYDDLYRVEAYDEIDTWIIKNQWKLNDLLSDVIKKCC